MKTLSETLSFASTLTGQYRRLLRNLGLLTLAMGVLGMSTVVYFDERLVAKLSSKLIASTADTMKVELISFFNTVDSNLLTAIEQRDAYDDVDGQRRQAVDLDGAAD